MRHNRHSAADDGEQSAFVEDRNLDIKNSDLMELHSSHKKFIEFVETLGQIGKVPLGDGNKKYSKEIMQEPIGASEVEVLVRTRVQKMIKNRRIKRNWGKEDCTILAWVLQKLTNGRHIKCPQKLNFFYWQAASEVIPGSTPEQCMFKWLSMRKIKLQNYQWQANESRILQKLVEEQGTNNWKEVSRQLYKANPSQDKKYRHPKQCREQWNCNLNPDLVKGLWQPEQDLRLLSLVIQQKGKRKWSNFSKSIIGRTENALKNRYAALIQNQKQQNPNASEMQLVQKCYDHLRQKLPPPQKEEIKMPPPNNLLIPSIRSLPHKEEEEASTILSGDFSTTAFKKPTFEYKLENKVEQEARETMGQIKIGDGMEVRQGRRDPLKVNIPEEKFRVKECSLDEIMRFMEKNRDVLIPARLGKNMELVALFPEHKFGK